MENGAVFQKSAWKSIFSLCIPALIRAKSEEWGLYADKIAVVGFSAGRASGGQHRHHCLYQRPDQHQVR